MKSQFSSIVKKIANLMGLTDSRETANCREV